MSRFATRVVTVTVLLAAVGCSSFIRNQFANPVVELKDVRLRGIGLQGGSLDVVLDVFNPNPYRLDASRLTYQLMVDTSRIAEGSIDKLVTLETQKKSEIVLPVKFSTQQLIGAASAMQKTGSVDYTVTGEVTVATPFGNFTRPYQGKGRFDSLRPF
jgi:LEA14-like dessication related protein